MREQVDALRNAGVRAELEILPSDSDGDLARVIAAAAKKRDADLIVTRQSRGDALPGEVSGDLARRLMRLAPCPVLVVPRAA